MYKSKDGKVNISEAPTLDSERLDLSEQIFPAADFSLVNVPKNNNKAASLFQSLYNTPTDKHMMLVFCRHSRAEKLAAVGNLHKALDAGWKFLNTVCISYDKPSSSSNIGLLPISEEAHIFYKGEKPYIQNTSWFREPNASTYWDVAPQPHEGKPHSYCARFSWEVALLMVSMCRPMRTGRFIYGFDMDHDSVFKLCNEHHLAVQMYTPDLDKAKRSVDLYNAQYGGS